MWSLRSRPLFRPSLQASSRTWLYAHCVYANAAAVQLLKEVFCEHWPVPLQVRPCFVKKEDSRCT